MKKPRLNKSNEIGQTQKFSFIVIKSKNLKTLWETF